MKGSKEHMKLQRKYQQTTAAAFLQQQQQQHHNVMYLNNGNVTYIKEFKEKSNSSFNDETKKKGQEKKKNNDLEGKKSSTSSSSSSNCPSNQNELVLVNKETLNDLTEQIAFSISKMKDLEEQVKIIPELQKRIDFVISTDTSASNSIKDFKNDNNYNRNRDNIMEQLLSSAQSKLNSTRNASFVDARNSSSGIGSSRRESYDSMSTNFSNIYNDSFGGSNNNINRSYRSNNDDNVHRQYNSFRYSINKQNNNNLTNNGNNNSNNYNSRNRPLISANHRSLDSDGCVTNAAINTNITSNSPQENFFDRVRACTFDSRSPINATFTSGYNNRNSSNNQNNNNNFNNSLRHHNNLHASPSRSLNNNNHNPFNYPGSRLSFNNSNMSSNLLITSAPIKSQLDCGCQSFKEHLRYNLMNREQRLNHARSQLIHTSSNNTNANNNNHNYIPQATTKTTNNNSAYNSQKRDAATMTDLIMNDIVTKNDYNNMIMNIHKTYSTLSSSSPSSSNKRSTRDITNDEKISSLSKTFQKLTSPTDDYSIEDEITKSYSSASLTNSKSNVQELNSNSKTGGEDNSSEINEGSGGSSSNQGIIDETENNQNTSLEDEVDDDDNDDNDGDPLNSSDGSRSEGGPYSLGSSYQDPSDFEEYYAFKDSIEPNIYYDNFGGSDNNVNGSYNGDLEVAINNVQKQYNSFGYSINKQNNNNLKSNGNNNGQTIVGSINGELIKALIRLNDFIKQKYQQTGEEISIDVLESNLSSSSFDCIESIRKHWFEVSTKKDSQVSEVKLYLDYFESFTKQLLSVVINLADSAGNTCLHYAASHFKLNIIKILLETKVCDVNRRNKAGYIFLHLLSLTNISNDNDLSIAKNLFKLADVNIQGKVRGETCLMLASGNGCLMTVKLLLECGADPSLRDVDGSSCLHYASEVGNEEIVKCLLEHKLTDIKATDNDGLDALTIAMNNGHKQVGLILYKNLIHS